MSHEVILEKLQIISEGTEIPFKTVCKFNYIQLYKMYLLLKNEIELKQLNFKQNNRILFDHGYHVVQKLNTEEKIINFVKLWRRHFIETTQPKFMPNGWSIDFRVKTNV